MKRREGRDEEREEEEDTRVRGGRERKREIEEAAWAWWYLGQDRRAAGPYCVVLPRGPRR